MIYILMISMLGAIFSFFMLVRVESVFRVRLAFIDDKTTWPELYEQLPPYSEMVQSPRHYFRWTKAHWMKYLEPKCTGCHYEIEHNGKKVCRTMTRTHGQRCDAFRERKE